VHGWPQVTIENMPAPPALGDIDGDDALEVVIGCGNGSGNCKYLYAWHGDGSLMNGFPMRPVGFNFWTDELYHDPVYSAALADYDGDGQVEIMVALAGSWGITIVEPNGTTNPDQSRETNADLMASPVVDDIDNDGKLETLIGGADSSGTRGEITIWDEAGTINDALPWPTLHHDMWRTGNVWGADFTPPTNPSLSPSGHAASTWSNDNTVRINLSGASDDESGVRGYYYAWDASPSTLLDGSSAFADATTSSITSDPLADGNAHYFHLRTLDYAGNLAADTEHLGPFWIDTQPPTSAASSPPFAAGSVIVSWQGIEAAPSGVESYDVQVREGAGGAWITWLDDVTYTQAVYAGTIGSTYFFRSIARDFAGNVEAPPDDGDTSTMITAYSFTGQVFNNREEPVYGAQVQMQPQPTVLGVLSSGWTGDYGLFFNDADTYQLTVQRTGFGALPQKSVSGGSVSGLDFYLPPVDDFIVDGNFELGSGTLDVSAWEIQGTIVPTLTEVTHTGLRALLMQGPGTAAVRQTLTLPDELDADSLTLSWMASVTGTVAAQDVLTAEVEVDGLLHAGSVRLPDMTVGDWTHGYLSVDAQESQVVTVRLMLEAASGALLRLDEISLGETHPGVCHVHLPIVLRNSQN
jgi:hypothetical protein